MMISPESYYDMNLKGKDAEQIMSAIRGLKNEIGHLKNIMEHPDYGSELIACPSESTRLRCTREYLERAKVALLEAGGEYKPSQAELKAKEFDNNLAEIGKIVFTIGGFFGGYETRTISFDDEKLQVSVQHSLSIEPEGTSVALLLPYTKGEFLDELNSLHIGEWRSSYSLKRFGYEVLDGTQWELEILYKNGAKPFKSYGDNAYPYNFDEFKELLVIDTSVNGDEEDSNE